MPDDDSRTSVGMDFLDNTWSQRIQLHHDYYVKLKLEGKLHSKDQTHYNLAMEREKQGEVKPFTYRKS